MLRRKNWLFLVLFLISFGIIFKKPVYAAERCTPSSVGTNVGGSWCKSDNFDCGNRLELPEDQCQLRGGCYEIETYPNEWLSRTYNCYLPKGSAAVPQECGYLGRICCSNNTCPYSGLPVVDFITCTCTVTGSLPTFFCPSGKEINTALGCIPVEIKTFVPWLLGWLFGIAGGVAFLLMAYGFILIATSSGDEKKIAGARETITSAIIGLLVCIFSIFILRLIVVNILQIPGF
jgi:hypothetical protein